jgi:hypothetical protein
VEVPVTDRRFTVTIFPDVAAETLVTREVTLDELRDMALAITADRKADLPLFKMCRFGDARTNSNSLRHNSNVLEIEGIETDYDARIMSFDQAVAVLRQSGLEALVYTSPRIRKKSRSGAPFCRRRAPCRQRIAASSSPASTASSTASWPARASPCRRGSTSAASTRAAPPRKDLAKRRRKPAFRNRTRGFTHW